MIIIISSRHDFNETLTHYADVRILITVYYYLQKHGLIPLFLISGHYQEESCPDGTPQ